MVKIPPTPIVPTGTDTTGADYGLSGDAATHKFDVTGLGIPGLTGMVDGKTLLQYFIASGSGRLGDGGQAAAAIQHALLFGQAYGDKFSPTFGKVGQKDAEAFAQSLNLLDKANTSQPQAVNGLKPPTESVYDYLSRNAALGAASGSVGGSVADLRDVSNIRLPDETSLMAIADKAFQAVQGKHATLDQQRAFARSYQQMFAQTETANADAMYAANPRVQDALAAQQPATSLAEQHAQPDPLADVRSTFQPNSALNPGVVHVGAQLGAGDLDAPAPSLSDTMGSLGQALGGQSPLLGHTNVTTQALPGDASAYAENFARNTDPKGAAAADTAGVFDVFRRILEGHFGG